MKKVLGLIVLSLLILSISSLCKAEVIFKSDFNEGDFADLGWKVEGPWDIFDYKVKNKNPGKVARFPANKPEEGKLIKTFEEVNDPKVLKLSLDYGWGWGAEDQGADSVSFMLLDSKGNGYIFSIGRWKARWCLQYGVVKEGIIPKEKIWAPVDMDFTLKSLHDPNFDGLGNVVVTREKGGKWTIYGKRWNKDKGGKWEFTDNTFKSFSQVVILGTKNFDEQVFNNITLEIEK